MHERGPLDSRRICGFNDTESDLRILCKDALNTLDQVSAHGLVTEEDPPARETRPLRRRDIAQER
jgi:hypothetical protein